MPINLTFSVLGQPQCKFCTKAVELLKEKGCEYTYYDVRQELFLLNLIKEAGHTTVPVIYDSTGKHIGGYTELKEVLS